MLTRENTICFGDSHSEYFTNIFTVKRYDASSAKGLNNMNSLTRTNQNIKNCIAENPTKNFVFYFGKVDIDFILNYKYNTDPQLDVYNYVDSIIDNYFTFLQSLRVSSIFILELPVSHLEDAILLNHINNRDAIGYINNYINNEIKTIKYTKVINWAMRNELIVYMGRKMEELCKNANYTYIPVNKYFLQKDGSYKIADAYIYENRFDNFAEQPHHLGYNISELYVQSLRELGLA